MTKQGEALADTVLRDRHERALAGELTPADQVAILAEAAEPFPAEQVDQLRKTWKDRKTGATKSFVVDYVGHARVTDRLNAVDPSWSWEPMAFGPDGLPLFDRDRNGDPVGLWIRLTIAGVTRLGYGNVDSGKHDAEKILIGDALRNAGMRFGIALDMWVKDKSEDAGGAPVDDPDKALSVDQMRGWVSLMLVSLPDDAIGQRDDPESLKGRYVEQFGTTKPHELQGRAVKDAFDLVTIYVERARRGDYGEWTDPEVDPHADSDGSGS